MTSRAWQMIIALPALACAAFGVGFWFHTSFDPTIFGKYATSYVVFLAIWYLLVTPLVYYATRFLLTRDELRLSRGRKLIVRRRSKLAGAAIVGLIAYLVLDGIGQEQMHRRTLTNGNDVFHPYLQNSLRPSNPALHTNRWGFRGEEIDQAKPDGTYRIFFFGGSTVMCESVPWEDSHPRLLEQRLRDTYPHRSIEVQNVGAQWHTTLHSLVKLESLVQDFHPNLVIMYHAINDLYRSFPADLYAEGPYRSDYSNYLGPVRNLVHPRYMGYLMFRSAFGCWMSDYRFERVRVIGPDGNGVEGLRMLFFPKCQEVEVRDWPSLAAFARNIRNFVHLARSSDIKVVLATQPYLYHDDLSPSEQELIVFPLMQQFQGKRASVASMRSGMDQFNNQTRRIAKELDVPLIELEAAVPKTLDYFYDDVHYTRRGNTRVAETVADFLIEQGMIERGAPSASEGG
ncbi:MAG TPA: hypothetical protein VG713_13465 [Pirellulales bacterium]|nr:hypothetical protein [Pirellulales bacterium]